MSDRVFAEKVARLTLKVLMAQRALPPPPIRMHYTDGPVGQAEWNAAVEKWRALRDERNERVVDKVITRWLSGVSGEDGE